MIIPFCKIPACGNLRHHRPNNSPVGFPMDFSIELLRRSNGDIDLNLVISKTGGVIESIVAIPQTSVAITLLRNLVGWYILSESDEVSRVVVGLLNQSSILGLSSDEDTRTVVHFTLPSIEGHFVFTSQ